MIQPMEQNLRRSYSNSDFEVMREVKVQQRVDFVNQLEDQDEDSIQSIVLILLIKFRIRVGNEGKNLLILIVTIFIISFLKVLT